MKLFDHERNGHKCAWSKTDKKKYADGWADFGDFKVYDRDVAKYAKKHLRFIDRFDIRKTTEAVLCSFAILSKSVEPPKGDDNWKF